MTYHLAEIGCDDHRVFINSSHICSDGGYLTSLIDEIQSKNGLPDHPKIPGSIVHFLRDELNNIKNNKNEMKIVFKLLALIK